MPPGQHSNHGASKASRWMTCPGSVQAEAGLPDHTSEFAREGTAAHEVGEMALRADKDAADYVGEFVAVDDEAIEVTEEMAEAVQVYLDFVRHTYGTEVYADHAEMMIEQRFDLSPLNPPVPMFGTSDCVIWRPARRHLHAIDYKHGQGVVVEAEGNKQLMYYALGAVVALRVMPATVSVSVVQPRAQHPAGPVRTWTFEWADLVEFKNELFAAAARTLEPNAPLVVGDHCKFCKALPTCPAQRKHAVAVAEVEFDVVEPDKVTLPTPDVMTPDQIAKVLHASDVVENWFRAIRGHVADLISSGQEVPGWKLVEKRANRKWMDEAAAAAFLEQAIGGDAYEEPKLKSPAQAEKKLDRAGKQEMAQYVVKQSSGTTLVPDTDPRPAVLSGQDEFLALPPGSTNEN